MHQYEVRWQIVPDMSGDGSYGIASSGYGLIRPHPSVQYMVLFHGDF